AAAVVGAIADYTGADLRLVRDARWIAAAGAIISPALLIADLGRPSRFLNMLRVFKLQSPMSVGAWTLVGFVSGASATAFGQFMQDRYGPLLPLRVIENAGQAVSLGLRVLSFLSRGEQARDLRKWAAISAIAGSLVTRFGWLDAGDVSAQDWREPLGIRHSSK